MPFVAVEGAELFFTDSGRPPSGADSTLVLIHGWTCDSHDWLFQFQALQAEHRVVAVDLRGHGRSTATEPDFTVQRHAADVAALLGRIGVAVAVAVGHSLGGSVAAALAVEHPRLVRAMVAVEPAYGQDEATVEWMRTATEPFGGEGGNELAAELQAATEPLAPEWLRTWHRRRTLGIPPAQLRKSFWDMYFCPTQISGQPSSDAYLARRTCPTLVFHRLPPMAAWERGILTHPDSKVVSWEGGGHWLHQDRPTEFNRLVLDWLASLPVHAPGAAGEAAPGVADGAADTADGVGEAVAANALSMAELS